LCVFFRSYKVLKTSVCKYCYGRVKKRENEESVVGFLDKIKDKQKREDSFQLLKMFSEVTKEKPKMWGSSIIGFGKYHYKSARSSQEGWWPLTGFSPRKQALTLYFMGGFKGHEEVLKKLGKHKVSGGSGRLTGVLVYGWDDIAVRSAALVLKRAKNFTPSLDCQSEVRIVNTSTMGN